MHCEACGGGRLEYTGMVGLTAVRLTCLRCGAVTEQQIALTRTVAPA